MSENTTETATEAAPTEQPTEVKPNWLQRLVIKYPRGAKVAAFTGLLTTALGAVHITKTVQANRHHAIAAGEHANEALSELSATVSPKDNPEA